MERKPNYILKFITLILLCYTNISLCAQEIDTNLLNIGDPAPQLQVSKWLKGTPLKSFEPGKIYVIEFWATWCRPCIASMPKLSEFARKHRNEITVVAIDVYEKNVSFEKIKRFVDSMGSRMDFAVAIDRQQWMEKNWLEAIWDHAIPKTFVINTNADIAWIGHPRYLEEVATKIMHNQWDIQQAANKRKLDKYLNELADSIRRQLFDYRNSFSDSEINVLQNQYQVLNLNAGTKTPDSVLSYLNKFIQQEPALDYHEIIVCKKLSALFQINMQESLTYGKKLLSLPLDEVPASDIIIALKSYASKHTLSKPLYELGAEAYDIYIQQIPYPQLAHTPQYYHEMAEWYWMAQNKQKAVEAEENAVNMLQNHADFTPSTSELYKIKLAFYKKMIANKNGIVLIIKLMAAIFLLNYCDKVLLAIQFNEQKAQYTKTVYHFSILPLLNSIVAAQVCDATKV